MIRREHMDEDRKRVEAYQALAHPAGNADESDVEESISPILMTHDGEEFEESEPEEDILEGLDVEGLDPRAARSREMSDPEEPVVVEVSEETIRAAAADESLVGELPLDPPKHDVEDVPGLDLESGEDDYDPAADNLAGQDEENMYGSL
jgi:hypothetical protein